MIFGIFSTKRHCECGLSHATHEGKTCVWQLTVASALPQGLGSSATRSEDCDDACLRTRSLPEPESQLLAELAMRNGVPVRCF